MFADLRVPVVVAPMAGGPSTPALVAGAASAGAFGFLAAGYLTPEAVRAQIAATRDLSPHPFGVNLFTAGNRSTVDLSAYRARIAAEAAARDVAPGEAAWDDDHYSAKLDVVVEERVPVVSFTFGLPHPEDVARLHEVDALAVVTVTTPREARAAVAVGADVLCVQGAAAGGHRSSFTNEPDLPGGGPLYDLLPLLRLVAAGTDVPLIAAGGLIHGADVAAVLAAGAVAAQLGTAFLRCPEAATQPAHRAALAAGTRETTLTRAFSGRPARGLANQFIADHDQHAPAAYPQLHYLTKPVRAAAGKAEDPEGMSMWAGQSYPLSVAAPVTDVVNTLAAQAAEAAEALTARLSRLTV